MSESDVNQGRRRLLLWSTSAVGAVGAVGIATPFVRSWTPNAATKSAGAPVKADISKLEAGEKMIVEWRGRPIWIVRRTDEALDSLQKVEPELKDPTSEGSKQPEYAQNEFRARNKEFLVLVGICTHLGCSPLYRPEVGAAASDLGDGWLGGFFCPCHGSKFDISGRVYSGAPAPSNLDVPPYYFESDNVVVVGEDGPEGAGGGDSAEGAA